VNWKVEQRLCITRIGTGLPDNHWHQKKKKVQHLLLVEPSNILLPPLHITLGLMKNFVEAVDQRGPGFRYLTEKLPGISTAEIVSDRYASSSEMSSLTEFSLVTRRGCGMISGI
jgi:hypothetical protein